MRRTVARSCQRLENEEGRTELRTVGVAQWHVLNKKKRAAEKWERKLRTNTTYKTNL